MNEQQRDPKTNRFLPGNSGRPAGTRNRLTSHLLNVLCKDFEENGEAVVKITRIEKPVEYLKIVASLLPKEFAVSDAKLGDLSDDEIATLISQVRELRASVGFPKADSALKEPGNGNSYH
jgi:hypothetical protein